MPKRKSVVEVLIEIINVFRDFKKEKKMLISLEEVRKKTGWPGSMLEKYLYFFEYLGQISVTTVRDERGILRKINLTNFTL